MPWGQIFNSVGAVVKDIREEKEMSVDEMLKQLKGDIEKEEYLKLEAGETEFDFWMLTLSRITVELGVPCRTLICDKGERGKQFQFAHETPTGTIIGKVRQSKSKTIKQMATVADIEIEIYKDIENGKSEIERWSKLLLHIAEILDTRVFEFLYPGHRIERPEQFASTTTAKKNKENDNDDDNDNDNEDK